MKKVVRMLGLCALVALAFTSCKKKETNSNLTFTASMPQTVSNDRTYLDDNGSGNLLWSANDTIKVLHEGENAEFGVISGKDTKTAYFDATGKEEFLSDLLTNNNTYFAFYPDAAINGNEATVILSDQQTYGGAYSFKPNTYPMFATNTGNNFGFHSNAGILRIQLRKTLGATNTVKVGSVELTSDDQADQLVGEMTYSTDYVLNPNTRLNVVNPKHQVILTCEQPEELLEGVLDNPKFNFDFVLFEGALQGAFNVKVRDERGRLIGNFNAKASEGDETNYNHTILKEQIIVMPVKNLDGTVLPE